MITEWEYKVIHENLKRQTILFNLSVSNSPQFCCESFIYILIFNNCRKIGIYFYQQRTMSFLNNFWKIFKVCRNKVLHLLFAKGNEFFEQFLKNNTTFSRSCFPPFNCLKNGSLAISYELKVQYRGRVYVSNYLLKSSTPSGQKLEL